MRAFLLGIIFTSSIGFGQTLVMNEVSQGVTGNMEWVEFVVIDTAVTYNCANPIPPCIDIRGWIFDDNSGYHGAPGVAGGAVRFSYNNFWSCLPLGTIIVIYNGISIDPSIPPIDVNLNDGNCRIVVPVNDVNLFESNLTTPGAIACSYPNSGWTAGGNWSTTLLANSGDCARIVDTLGCEVFSVCYGTANINTSIYFANGADGTTSHANTVYYFNGGNPNVQSNWSIGCTDNEVVLDATQCGSNVQTPGFPNNAANEAYIAQFNNGCQPITPTTINLSASSNESCTCDGTATVNASGSIPGYTYQWLNASLQPIGQNGQAATGLCDGTYYAVATSSIGCSDTVSLTILGSSPITMNPTANQVLCSGQSSNPTNFTGAPAGTIYQWQHNGNAVGLPPSGVGNITATVLNNATTTNDTLTFIVTPTLNGCNGIPDTFEIILKPLPAIGALQNITACPGETITVPAFGATIPGTTFAWTNSNANIGLGLNGSGNIPSFTAAANSTGGTVIGTIDIVPAFNGCSGPMVSLDVSILPAPTVGVLPNITVCSGEVINVTDFSSLPNGATFSWTNSNTDIGLSASGNGQIPDFTADIPNGISNAGSNVSVVPTIDGCSGNPSVFTIQVFATPSFNVQSTNPTLCNVDDGSITLSGLQTNTTFTLQYQLDGNNTSVSPTSDANGQIILSNLSNGIYSNITVQLGPCSEAFPFTVSLVDPNSPILDPVNDTIVCDVYSLPVITGTNLSGLQGYYTLPNGTGSLLSSGTEIFNSQVIYIYDEQGACNDEESFVLTVISTPNSGPDVDTSVCNSFILPAISVQNSSSSGFYTLPQNGQALPTGSALTETTSIIFLASNQACSDVSIWNINILAPPTLESISYSSGFCEGEEVPPITGTISGNAPFVLTINANGISEVSLISNNTFTISANEGENTIVSIADSNGCLQIVDTTIMLAAISPPDAPIASGTGTYCSTGDIQPLTVNVPNANWYIDTNSTPIYFGNTFVPSDEVGTTTYFVNQAVNGCKGPFDQVQITIEDCFITVPTAFTPNNDGRNDTWEILNLTEAYPKHVVFIYNRWGGLLFTSEEGKYDEKPWNGTFNEKPLPVGSYYYIIQTQSDKGDLKGIISIISD